MTAPRLIATNRDDEVPRLSRAHQHYYAEVPIGSLDAQSQLIEQVIRFAFDTLGVRHLDVRVFGVGQELCRASEQSLRIGAPSAPGAQRV